MDHQNRQGQRVCSAQGVSIGSGARCRSSDAPRGIEATTKARLADIERLLFDVLVIVVVILAVIVLVIESRCALIRAGSMIRALWLRKLGLAETISKRISDVRRGKGWAIICHGVRGRWWREEKRMARREDGNATFLCCKLRR